MSYGGIGSTLSGVAGAALIPAMETYLQDMISKGLVDEGLSAFVGDIVGGTLGTVLSTGLDAGLGYATGGKEGAAAGAVQGLIIGGGTAMQHDRYKEAMGMGDTPTEAPRGELSAMDNSDPASIASSEAWKSQLQKTVPTIGGGQQDTGTATPPSAGASQGAGDSQFKTNKPGYFQLTGELAMPAMAMGMGLGSSMSYANKRRAQEEAIAREDALKEQRLRSLMANMFQPAYADGGEVKVSSNGATVTFPDWFVDEFAHTGGLGGYAAGGYINTQPMNPDAAYPQSMIPRAQAYPAASPVRHEVVNMERGGLLEGEGDGMSDHIPANISGKESVRVADGEYVVPKRIAEKIGEDKLQTMLAKVRAASHAKKGKQIIENAGKRAFIQAISGVKA